MLIFNFPSEIKPLKLPNLICSIGVFDGIHIGHQKIISSMVHRAKNIKGTSLIITFSNHPYAVLNPSHKLKLLTKPHRKMRLLEEMGIDACILMKFNKNIASITAEEWTENILWKQLHINSIYLGKDSFFGKKRKGNTQFLRKEGKRFGFEVFPLDKTRINRLTVSSSLIRKFISKGDLANAKQCLGRPYSVCETAVKGAGIGTSLGFPTINLDIKDLCLPPSGVYAVMVKNNISSKIIPAVANIGTRPTFKRKHKSKILLEVHVLDSFSTYFPNPSAALEQEIEVIFIKKLREERKFEAKTALIRQIEKDVINAGKCLKMFPQKDI